MTPVDGLRAIQLAIAKLMNLANNPYADTRRVSRMFEVIKLAERVARQRIALKIASRECPHCGKAFNVYTRSRQQATGSQQPMISIADH